MSWLLALALLTTWRVGDPVGTTFYCLDEPAMVEVLETYPDARHMIWKIQEGRCDHFPVQQPGTLTEWRSGPYELGSDQVSIWKMRVEATGALVYVYVSNHSGRHEPAEGA